MVKDRGNLQLKKLFVMNNSELHLGFSDLVKEVIIDVERVYWL